MKSFILTILSCILLFNCQSNPIEADYIIKNINIVDVEKGKLVRNRNVAINDDKIVAIRKRDIKHIDSTIVIDGTKKFLIPGLWDMHAHYNESYKFANYMQLANGITGVRDMWGIVDTIHYIREETKKGNMLAPDIYNSGNVINGHGSWWGWKMTIVNGENEVVEAVRQQAQQEVDFIKIYHNLTKDDYLTLANICKELNIPFAGHVPFSVNIWEAIEVNQRSLEHFKKVLEGVSSDQRKLDELLQKDWNNPERTKFLYESFDQKLFDSLAVTLANSDTWICPTFIYWKGFLNRDNPEIWKDTRLEYMPKNIKLFWETPQEVLTEQKEFFAVARKKLDFEISLIGKMVKAGVKILAGTDYDNPFCYPGFSLHDELSLMVEGGMTPSEALKTATYNPALFMEKEKEIGQVAEGYTASLVLLNDNPLEDINNTRDIDGVFLRGQYFDRLTLSRMLNEVKEISSNM